MDDSDIDRAQREYRMVVPQYDAFTKALRSLVEGLCPPDLEIDNVQGRTKSVPSLVAKLRERRDYTSLDDVVDKSGIRLIAADCSLVVPTCEFLTTEFKVVDDVRHGAKSPDTFGYTSRHLVVEIKPPRSDLPEWQQFAGMVAEIQVRSVLQHAWALISHRLAYKSSAEMPERVQRQLSLMAAVLEDADERFAEFRSEVTKARAEIREKVEREAWEKVGLDLFSLEEAWTKFPWREVDATAVGAGFEDVKRTYELPLDEGARWSLSLLVRVATAAGIPDLGQLSRLARDATTRGETLVKISEILKPANMHPHSTAPNVLALLLVHDHAADKRVIDAASGEEGLTNPLVEAAVKAAQR